MTYRRDLRIATPAALSALLVLAIVAYRVPINVRAGARRRQRRVDQSFVGQDLLQPCSRREGLSGLRHRQSQQRQVRGMDPHQPGSGMSGPSVLPALSRSGRRRDAGISVPGIRLQLSEWRQRRTSGPRCSGHADRMEQPRGQSAPYAGRRSGRSGRSGAAGEFVYGLEQHASGCGRNARLEQGCDAGWQDVDEWPGTLYEQSSGHRPVAADCGSREQRAQCDSVDGDRRPDVLRHVRAGGEQHHHAGVEKRQQHRCVRQSRPDAGTR